MKNSVSKKSWTLAAALCVAAILLIALPFYFPGDLPYILLLLGRFHPVILHFPIVLIVLSLVLEIMRRSGMIRRADLVVTMILVTAALSSVVAIASGFLLFGSGDYSGALMQQHLWSGVITGVGILLTAAIFLVYRYSGRFYSVYLILLVASNASVALASHLGGSLTHGEDYLTEYVPMLFKKDSTQQIKDPGEMMVYEDVLMPVFDAKCLSCHNESRAKGEFSMAGLQQMIKGGESGVAGIVAGKPDSSEIYKRIMLPEGHTDRMPPEGKMPMTNMEVQLLQHWIVSGAKSGVRVNDAMKDAAMQPVFAEVLPSLNRYRRRQQLSRHKADLVEKELAQLAMELNIDITRDTAADETGMYFIAMKFPPGSFDGSLLPRLNPYADVFSRISLVSSGIGDDALYHLSEMKNVKSLFLQKTAINGSGLVYLQKMNQLEVLNLSYTRIDDKSALDLLKIPNLREVYLMQTNVSPEVVKALQAYRPSVQFLVEEGPYR